MNRDGVIPLVFTALFAAVTCVLSPFAIPIGPVPISPTTLILCFSIYVLGTRYAVLSCIIYLMLGMVGLPVFSRGQGGIGILAGPTGGYLAGYILFVFVGGMLIDLIEKKKKEKKLSADSPEGGTADSRLSTGLVISLEFISLVLATILLYSFGTAWFCISTGTDVGAALAVCVIPFIPGDLVKIAVSVASGSFARSLVRGYS